MLFLAAAFFVGSQQCHACHAAVAEAYARTREFLRKAQSVDAEVRLRLAGLEPDAARAAALLVRFGPGTARTVDRVVVHWAGGGVQEVAGVAVDQVVEIKERT